MAGLGDILTDLVKSGVAFTIKDIIEMDRAFEDANPDSLLQQVRFLAKQFTYGTKIEDQREDYVTSLVKTGKDFSVVFHPESMNADLYRTDLALAKASTEAEDVREIDVDESYFKINYAGAVFDGTTFERQIDITFDPERMTHEELIEEIEDIAENFVFADVEDVDILIVNGEEIDLESDVEWHEYLFNVFYLEEGRNLDAELDDIMEELEDMEDLFEDEDDPIDELEDNEEEDESFLGNLSVESQGRLRIPAGVVDVIRKEGSVTITYNPSANIFNIWG